ncbi:MAG: nascent polypeptide-associated complex protein [Thermoproteota archaeon]|jgi:nascent polypeptide-associated complex subunit alpha|nr:nascent polypeptide-associated complex protein [Thermoproteota archaeon]
MFRRGINRETLRMLQRMGVSFENLEGIEEVVLKFKDKIIILKNPEVMVTKISGQKLYQIAASEEIEEKKEVSEYIPNEEDIQLVMQQANASREEAISALKETEGDIASAIILIKARKQ